MLPHSGYVLELFVKSKITSPLLLEKVSKGQIESTDG